MAGLADRLWRSRAARGVAFGTAVALFLSVIGAMGSGEVPFWTRTAWFLAYAGFAGMLTTLLVRCAGRLAWTRGHLWRRVVIVASPMTPIMALAVWLGTGVASGEFRVAALPLYLLYSAVTSFAMVTFAFAVLRPTAMTHAAPAGAEPPRFLTRLPVRLRHAEIWAVQAEDHYLRVHTASGQDLILMRLGDAVEELEGIEGAQTHRSWWVARGAVKDVKRGDGRATLVLCGGLEAPVSRSYRRTLREAGWL